MTSPSSIISEATEPASAIKHERTKARKRKAPCLPHETVEYLKAWMMSPEHIAHPYPTEAEKKQIMQDTGIELRQLTNWFVNNRKRYWKPRLEAKLAAVAGGTEDDKGSSHKELMAALAMTKVAASLKVVAVTPQASPARVTRQSSSKLEAPATLDATAPSAMISENSSAVSDSEVASLEQEDFIEAASPVKGTSVLAAPALVTPDGKPERRSPPVMLSKGQLLEAPPTFATNESASQIETTRKKRNAGGAELEDRMPTPRPKYRRVSLELWKDACHRGYHDHQALPSLEEARQLFGYHGIL